MTKSNCSDFPTLRQLFPHIWHWIPPWCKQASNCKLGHVQCLMSLACAAVCFMLIPHCLWGSQLKERHFPQSMDVGFSQSKQDATGDQCSGSVRRLLCPSFCQLFEGEIVLRWGCTNTGTLLKILLNGGLSLDEAWNNRQTTVPVGGARVWDINNEHVSFFLGLHHLPPPTIPVVV